MKSLLPLALALAALGGCTRDYKDLAPFPCAADGTCPGGLSCQKSTCVVPRLDSPCLEEPSYLDGGTDCSGAADGGVCALGVCTTRCSSSSACPIGRVCSLGKLSADSVCLFDCGRGQACPAGTACTDLQQGGARGCAGGAPTSTGVSCSSVVLTGSCSTAPPFTCGASYDTLPCAGGYCPSICSCVPANANPCRCPAGFSTAACDRTLCSQADCSGGGSWGCLQQANSTADCVAVLEYAQGSCQCSDGRSLGFECGTSSTCEQLCQAGP